jgi:hypothetical protein
MGDFRLLPRCKRDLRSSEMLRSEDSYLDTNVSTQPIDIIIKGREGTDFVPKRR